MKPIEELTQEDITQAGDIELYRIRLRFCQVFEKRERADEDTDMMLPGYAFLTAEMKRRELTWTAEEIDIQLFKAQCAIESENESEEETPEEVADDQDLPQDDEIPEVTENTLDVSIVSKSDDDDERIVMAVVYAPDEEDTQGDEATAEEIEKACYSFMENGQVYFVMHKGARVDICVLENYLAPVDFSVETERGTEKITKGTWLLVSRIPPGELWAKVKSGELTGYSMGGTSQGE